jgi:hypothetical protein
LIVLGESREGPEQSCNEVTLVGHTPNPYNIENEETSDHPDIFLCRRLKQPLTKIWPRTRSFG